MIAYIDRNNEVKVELLEDGSPISSERQMAITDIELLFGDVSLKTSTGELERDGATIKFQPGQHLSSSREYVGYLTVFDSVNVDGIAWDVIKFDARRHPTS